MLIFNYCQEKKKTNPAASSAKIKTKKNIVFKKKKSNKKKLNKSSCQSAMQIVGFTPVERKSERLKSYYNEFQF